MDKLADVVKPDPPRLVVLYKRDDKGQDLFQWDITGQMPVIGLIGALSRAQTELPHGPYEGTCFPQLMFFIEWTDERFHWRSNSDIPLDSLLGMIETIKMAMVSTHLARQQANQQMIVGPDGRPIH